MGVTYEARQVDTVLTSWPGLLWPAVAAPQALCGCALFDLATSRHQAALQPRLDRPCCSMACSHRSLTGCVRSSRTSPQMAGWLAMAGLTLAVRHEPGFTHGRSSRPLSSPRAMIYIHAEP